LDMHKLLAQVKCLIKSSKMSATATRLKPIKHHKSEPLFLCLIDSPNSNTSAFVVSFATYFLSDQTIQSHVLTGRTNNERCLNLQLKVFFREHG
jgi:hypothetical protein